MRRVECRLELAAAQLQARLHSFVPGRRLDDDFAGFSRLSNGALATITASQVNIGAQNDNGFRVVGEQGTIEWAMLDHLSLRVFRPGAPVTT